MNLTDRPIAFLARQLGKPDGPAGRIVGRILNRRNHELVQATVDAACPGRPAAAVDVGFGGGVGLRALLDRADTVHGVEMSDTMIADARRGFAESLGAGRLVLHTATMSDLPFDDGSVDAIITTNTVYFVDDLDAALRELRRVLSDGGRLAIGIGDPDEMAAMPVTSHGFRLRPVADIVAALTAAGFDEVRSHPVGRGRMSTHVLVGTR